MEILQELRVKPLVIFTTAYSRYALQSYEYEAIDYLLKHIEFERFQMAINKVQDRIKLQSSKEPFFY